MKVINIFIIISLSLLFINSCKTSKEEKVVEVIARDFSFEVNNEIPSGWTTFQFKNMGHAEHFFLLNLLPDTISFQTYQNQVTKPFDVVFDSLKAGKSKPEAISMLIEMIPSWYFTSVKQMGGAGIISSGKTTEITLNLVPGNYAMECYIKEKGVFHTALGMIRAITVTEEVSNLVPPVADLSINLTNFQINTEGTVKPGKNIVAVNFKEHPEVGLGNDVHLIKLNDNIEMDSVINWLDWMNIKGLESPAPVEFLGGTQEMPVGYTSYFTVNLEKGNYAWVSEPNAAQGMVKKFALNED